MAGGDAENGRCYQRLGDEAQIGKRRSKDREAARQQKERGMGTEREKHRAEKNRNLTERQG